MKKCIVAVLFTMLLVLSISAAIFAAPLKVAFFDENIKQGWLADGAKLKDYLESEGYEVMDSEQVTEFVTARIADKKPSVIVFCLDKAPQSLAPKASKTAPLRQYLDAGGKVVWLGDIPLYYVVNMDDGSEVQYADNGGAAVLSVSQTGTRDQNEDCTLTPDGEKWGLTEAWETRRSIKISKLAAATITVLATAPNGDAAGWVKSYGGPEGTGFVRIWDRDSSPSDYAWVKAVAEYGLK